MRRTSPISVHYLISTISLNVSPDGERDASAFQNLLALWIEVRSRALESLGAFPAENQDEDGELHLDCER